MKNFLPQEKGANKFNFSTSNYFFLQIHIILFQFKNVTYLHLIVILSSLYCQFDSLNPIPHNISISMTLFVSSELNNLFP